MQIQIEPLGPEGLAPPAGPVTPARPHAMAYPSGPADGNGGDRE
jgi:hypothetical protein